jgi:peptidoglycan hydrolase CwlO-like protein
MSNLKSLAEDMIQLTNSSNRLDEVIHLLKSSENTLVDDVKALIEGAKLECVIDKEKVFGYLDEIDSYRWNAEDEISSAHSSIDDATSSIGYLEDEINALRRYLEELKWEKKEDKK